MKTIKEVNLQIKELFQAYKKFVSENPQTISDLETTAKWISYFFAGRISDSSITSELVYALSNMLVFYNDRIIENSKTNRSEVNPTAQKLKVMLTTLEYCEVFLEIGSKRLWGKKGRWYFIVAIQLIKSMGRFLLFKQYNQGIITSPPIQSLDRKKIAEKEIAMTNPTTEGFNDFKLKRSGRVIRRVEGAPPIQYRNWQSSGESSTSQKKNPVIRYAEYVYIVKPLVHLAAVQTFGYKSWKSYTIALLMDLYTIHTYYKHQHLMTKEQKVELSKRCVNLLLYLVRSPMYEKKSAGKIDSFLNFIASHIPFAKNVCNPIMQYIPQWQSTYFYMWST
ncbi:PEX16 family protein [Megaselia abdita]